MHNLGTVMRFEIARTLKKKSFWIAALAVPVVVALVGVIVFFSNTATSEQAEKLAEEKFSIGITDESQLITPATREAVGAQSVASEAEGKELVKSGQLDAYIHYPADPSTQPINIYGEDVGLFDNSRYQAVAEQLIEPSAAATVDPGVKAILQGSATFNTTTYTSEGNVSNGFMNLIAPGMFLVLFYFMIATFGNQMLTSVTEEKENRVIEMILATIKPTTLLVGKMFSLVILALIQVVVILIPIIIGYLTLKEQLTLPNIDLSQIPIDPVSITIGAAVFLVSFLLFSGILMTIGAAMPTAKEANSFFGAALIFLFGPLYAAPLFVSSPESPLVQILSYFPLTAPIPLLLRNAVGNLSILEAGIAIAILAVATAIAIGIGVRIFRFGALEYSRKLSLREIFGKN